VGDDAEVRSNWRLLLGLDLSSSGACPDRCGTSAAVLMA
jgi:hypothetical protein